MPEDTKHLDLTREDHAYFFGFFQTDGHLSAGPGRKGKAAIEVSKRDEATLHAFSGLFPGLYSSVTHRTRQTNFHNCHEAVIWGAFAEPFRVELRCLGIPVGKKSAIVAPPVVPFDVRGYLRGLVDGDGSVGFTRSGAPFVSFVTASAPLAEFFCAQVLAVTGAVRTAKPNTRDQVYNPMVANDPAASLARWLYPAGCLALERKRRAAAEVSAWTRPTTMRARGRHKRWTAEEDAVVFSTTVHDAAVQLGRTRQSVNVRRWRLRNGRAAPGVRQT